MKPVNTKNGKPVTKIGTGKTATKPTPVTTKKK